MPKLETYEDAKAYLYGLKHHGAKYGIDRMQLLAEAMNHPERNYPIIHVAGTNGKGSVCAILENIYRNNNYKTGLYTSPHLVYQGERVQVNRKILDQESVLKYIREIKADADRLAEIDPDDHPSFFEFMTAMAFLHFNRSNVDIGIIETGLGGRLDATNIVKPEISIITSISLDHCEQLGDTIEKIATEKAGIIKKNCPIVIGRLPKKAENIIRKAAKQKGAKVYSIRERFGENLENCPEINLEGSYQNWNAATAVLATEVLQHKLPVKKNKLNDSLNTVQWPCRWDRFQVGNKNLILDVSHNIEGAEMLDENLTHLVEETGKKPIILACALGEYKAKALMPIIAKHAKEIYLLTPSQPRAYPFNKLLDFIPKEFIGKVHNSTVKKIFPNIGECSIGSPDETVVATGSIYLAGEICEALYHKTPVAEQILQDTLI